MYANSCLHRNMWANRFASSVAHVHSHQKRNREIFIGKLWHRRRFHAKRFFFIQYAHTHTLRISLRSPRGDAAFLLPMSELHLQKKWSCASVVSADVEKLSFNLRVHGSHYPLSYIYSHTNRVRSLFFK